MSAQEFKAGEPTMAEALQAAYAQGLAARPQEPVNAELLQAAKLVLAWFEAENDHAGTDFYERMGMCSRAEEAIREAIAHATKPGADHD